MKNVNNTNQDHDYSTLINKYKDLAYSIALKITKNDLDSEEIVQDSFLKAFNGLKNFKNESQFSTWFYRIVYNTSISSIRRKKYQSVEIDNKMIAQYENTQLENVLMKLDDQDRKHLISEAMSKLSEIDYTVLSLFYYEELSLKNISKIVNKDQNYLKVLIQRARIKLYQSLSSASKLELKGLL